MISLGIGGHVHRFGKRVQVERPDPRSSYFGRIVEVETCACGFSLEHPDGGYSNPPQKAWDLMNKIAEEMHKPSPEPKWENGMPIFSYGSGWFCETPAAIGYLMDTYGEDYAARLLRQIYATGDCSPVTRMVFGY